MANMTTADIATELETTARNLRKFLRADAKNRGIATPGKGSRYSIPRREFRGLQKRFTEWENARTAQDSADSDA